MSERAYDWVQAARPGVRAITPYVPGKPIEDLMRELGLTQVTKLASNENPLGPSQAVRAAIHRASEDLHRYPDGAGINLKQAIANQIADWVGACAPNQITLGNGSNEILDFVVRAFVNPGDAVMYSAHAFAVYPLVAQAAGALQQEVPVKDWGHDLDAMLTVIQDPAQPTPKVVFIANPNNPTGTWITREALQTFLAQVPSEIIVVLDQAYAEYMQDPAYAHMEPWMFEYPNLLITRTFSKIHGLAALRVGYGVCSASMARVLDRVRQPFNTSHLAQVAALTALQDTEYVAQSQAQNIKGLGFLTQAFEQMGLSYIPTEANFLAFKLAVDAGQIYQKLLEQGVIVRPIASYGMPEWLRVSVGTDQENQIFLSALKTLLC